MYLKTIPFVVAAFLLALAPGLSVAGDINVLTGGVPAGGATVSIETLGGETLATTQTNMNGIAKANIPQRAASQPVVYRVKDKAGNVSRNFVAKPSELTAMDTDGGIISYDEGSYGHLREAKEPISVGANGDVGCGAKLKEKVTETVGGVLGGFLGGVGGGGAGGFSGIPGRRSGGGGGFSGIPGMGGGGGRGVFSGGVPPEGRTVAPMEILTRSDPVSDAFKRVFTDSKTGTKIAVGTQLTPEGLLVSTNILNAPCDGTFQSVHLMDAQGNKAGPTRYDVYEMYQDWWLKVSWTFDRWEGNKHVEHKEGGWSDEGRNILGTFAVPHGKDGIWNRMGFSNAVQGIKGLGTFFPVSPRMFESQPMTLVVHVANADADPVTTTPFVIGLAAKLKKAVGETAQRSGIQNKTDDVKQVKTNESGEEGGLSSVRSGPLFPNIYTDFSSPLISEQVGIVNVLTNLRADLRNAERYGNTAQAEGIKQHIKELSDRLKVIHSGESGGDSKAASNVSDPKTAAKIDDLLLQIKKKKYALAGARSGLSILISYSREYTDRYDSDIEDITGNSYSDVKVLRGDISSTDALIKKLEDELNDLEKELKRLKSGGIDSVIDHLQPIIVLS